jgi:small-conductance mechanosensitive channel
MLNALPGWLRKALPTLILLSLVVIASFTDWMPAGLHKSILDTLKGYGTALLPMVGDLLVGALFLSIAHLLYAPLSNGLCKALARSGASNRGKTLVTRSLQIIYWSVAIFIAASMLAPDLLAKLFLGVSLFGAALALALQGMMKEVISGALLQLMPKFEVGQHIEVVGIADAKGKVVDIEYLSTKVEAASGPIIIPNSKIWENPVKLVPPPPPPAPPKSLLILPGDPRFNG